MFQYGRSVPLLCYCSTYPPSSKCSEKYQRKDTEITSKSLIVQALIPLLIVVAPFGLSLVGNMIFSNWFPDVMSDWAVEPLDIMMVVVSFHASTHSLTMILTTPAFRSQLAQIFMTFMTKTSTVNVRRLSQGTFTTAHTRG
ncbi:hypothetical protein PRIPAC_82455 [Pristionchus pacificus]|nr:hypothetical protein PRIPAC_82455 [Pristionchus pacificus]